MSAKARGEAVEQKRGLDAGADQLTVPLARMAEALAAMHAPVGVRNHCAAEARRRLAEPRHGAFQPHARSHSQLWNAKSAVSAAAVSLLAAAAICWIIFAPAGFAPFSYRLPVGSGPAAIWRNSAAPANRAAAVTGEETNASGQYVSLPYSDPSIANGTETTVEVSMPVSQLIAWGVPAPGREMDEVIPVELVLGDDGLPRAVQVLSETSAPKELYP